MSDVYIVRRGGEASERCLYLVKNGALGEGTGSFNISVNDPGMVSGTVEQQQGNLRISLGPWNNGTSAAYLSYGSCIDVTKYKTLHAELSQYADASGNIGLQSSQGWGHEIGIKAFLPSKSRQHVSMDISSVSGYAYPCLYINGAGINKGNTVWLYNMWLER